MTNPYHIDASGLATIKARADAIRDHLAANRLLRATAQTLDIDVDKIASERRQGERRAQQRDGGERRYHCTEDLLASEAHRASERRFAGTEAVNAPKYVAPHSALMGLDS